jgi:hypothetical protein
MTQSQKDKYLKFNDAIDLVIDATQQKMNLYVGISSGNILTLGDEDFTENAVFHLRAEPGSPTLDGDWVFLVPATQRFFGVINDTGFTTTVRSAGSPGNEVEILDGGRATLHGDGETIEEFKRETYDVAFFAGTPGEGEILGSFTAIREFFLPAALAGSHAYALTVGGGGEPHVIFTLKKNGSNIGTITFEPLLPNATFSFASKVTFVAGDRLELHSFGVESPTIITSLRSIGFSLKGVLV